MSLISHFKFENNVYDRTGNHTATPTSITYETGKNGLAGVFGGSSYLTFTPDFSTASNTNWTVSVWLKFTSTAQMSILSNLSGGPVSSDLRVLDGKMSYYHYNGGWIAE